MGKITVVHTADLHLGAPCKGLPPNVGRQRRKDTMQTLARISELCREHQSDLLLISGDLWEQEYITRPLVDYIADQFRRIPGTRVVIAPGRSDCNDEGSFYREYPWSDNVHIFHQPQLSSIWIPHLNTRIYGRAWAKGDASLDWAQLANNPDDSQLLVVAYGDPETLAIPQDILALDNLAYVALGGSHRHVAWTGKVLDPGCPEPFDFEAEGPRGVLKGTIGAATGSLEYVVTSSRRYYNLTVTLKESSQEEAIRTIREAIQDCAPDKNLFCIKLLGAGGRDLLSLNEDLADIFYLKLVDKTQPGFDVESLAAEHNKGVVGKYIAAIKQLQCEEGIRARALNLGLDALLSGRVAPW